MLSVKKSTKRLLSIALSVTMLCGLVKITPLVAKAEANHTIADWKFGQGGVKSGTIAGGNLILEDQSGNNNDLKMQLYNNKQLTTDTTLADWTKYLSFDNNTMNASSDGSMIFNGNNSTGIGADFITVDNADINQNKFENGYTIEFLYYFPKDWTTSDEWMGLMARQVDSTSNVKSMQEPQLGSTSISVSNCKEIQFLTAPANDNEKMNSAAWSVSMDKGGVWYHIAITSDGNMIRTYVNGCEAFRDYNSNGMDGLFADANDGRFRIGSSWWMEGSQTLDKFLKGNLQEVRISNTALDKTSWLISDPEQYVGEYGNNERYVLQNDNDYNFVFLPDTQNTVKFKPVVMDKAIDELINTADELNVAGVVSLGDIVENNNDGTQYNNARNIFYQLPDAGIKFMAQAGNHDGWSSGISNYYNSFSKNSTLFMNRTASYLTNDSPSGNSSYMLVPAGSYNYLVLSLSCSGSASGSNNNTAWESSDEAWFKNVLSTYPNCPTIVTTHDLQNCSATSPNTIQLSTQGRKLWDIVKNYDQVFMMVGGHSHGSGVEILNNINGKPVISILADYQFSYNGGNGFFKYAEFDENNNKIYLNTYSPYSASLSANEKTFFDVNFMTGAGNYNEIELDFKNRFSGMEIPKKVTSTEGKWMSGEYHSHTSQSNDAQVSSSKVENMLDIAFRDGTYTKVTGADNITNGTGFDYFFLADHFRKSIADADGNSYASSKYTPRYIGLEQQMKKFNQLQVQGKYKNKLFYSGFEWDAPGLDHVAIGIIDSNTMEVPFDGIHEFEWLYADQNNDPDSLYENNGSWELNQYGPRKATTSGGRSDVSVTYDALEWLKNNYPDSYALVNHPSRHNGGSGAVTVENLRIMNDIAPTIVFGFEGMPGNHLSPDETRCEMNDIYGGADIMLAKVGGIWDSMLGEGRHFYNFTNSDSHFKINGSNSSGYFPSEFSRNYTFVNSGNDNTFDYKDVVEGLRTGNSFAVYGDLIDALEFTATSGSNTAVMGSDLTADTDDKINIAIRFKSPSYNNYKEITSHNTTVTNEVSVDHVDLICGEISGKLNASDYNNNTNSTTKIMKTFHKDEWGTPDSEGYYTINYEVTADTSKYYRLRGTNLAPGTVGYTDENGNPLKDIAYTKTSVPDFNTRVNSLNDRNYKGLWFYSNPIFVYAKDSKDATLSNINISSGTLNPVFDSNTAHYTAEVGYDVDCIEVIPKASNIHSIIAVNNTQVVTGAAIALNVGSNNIHILVTAQDGITTSEYVVSITRKEPVSSDLVSITGPSELILKEGYQGTSTNAFTITGKEPVKVTKTHGDNKISWNDATKSLDIESGLVSGSYPITLQASNGISPDGTFYFVLKIIPDTVELPDKTISISKQNGTITAKVSGVATFQVITTGITEGTPVMTNWCEENGKDTLPPVGVSISAEPVVSSGASIRVVADSSTIPGTYYFKVKCDGVTSQSIKLTILPKQKNYGSTGGSTIDPSQIITNVETVSGNIMPGNLESTLTHFTIERITRGNGEKKDRVSLQQDRAEEIVKKLKENEENTVRIVIPDENDEVSETSITISSTAVNVLAKEEINLKVEMQEVAITISKEELKKISDTKNKDIYFYVVPLKKENEKAVLKRGAELVVGREFDSTKESPIVIGNPVEIITNLNSVNADITLSLSKEDIPSNLLEREAYLKLLAVYIKHADGEEELVQGTIVETEDNTYGIRFHISKFSSYAVVKTDALLKSSECNLTKVTLPFNALIENNNIFATVGNHVNSIRFMATVSEKAEWELYSDKDCTKEVRYHKLKLNQGDNYAYIKVVAEDGTEKIYTLKIRK